MKILFAHERLGAHGGAEANLRLTAEALRQRGHAIGLAHEITTGREEARWHELFENRYLLQGNQASAGMIKALRDFQPDVIYLHRLANLKALAAVVASGIPSLRMVHDHDLYCMRGYKYHWPTRRICTRACSWYCLIPCGAFLARDRRRFFFPLRWVSYRAKKRELALNRRIHRLVVATQYMAGELARNGFDPSRIVIHAPVTQPPTADFRANFSPRNLILFVGQIIRGKGVDILLQSLARVVEPFECQVFGDGHHRRACEHLTQKLGLTDRVKFKGFVPQEVLLQYYREASLMLVSSVWPEPFGAAGLEGMRYGLPVVAFDVGGIREWLTDGWNGFLAPWMNRARFAECVDTLLADKTLAAQLGERGRQWVLQEHTVDKYVENLEQTLAQVAAEGREVIAA